MARRWLKLLYLITGVHISIRAVVSATVRPQFIMVSPNSTIVCSMSSTPISFLRQFIRCRPGGAVGFPLWRHLARAASSDQSLGSFRPSFLCFALRAFQADLSIVWVPAREPPDLLSRPSQRVHGVDRCLSGVSSSFPAFAGDRAARTVVAQTRRGWPAWYRPGPDRREPGPLLFAQPNGSVIANRRTRHHIAGLDPAFT